MSHIKGHMLLKRLNESVWLFVLMSLVLMLTACTARLGSDPTETAKTGETETANALAPSQTFQWVGKIVVNNVETRHLELVRNCDAWALMAQSDDVTKKLESNISNKVLIWERVNTEPSIIMRQAIKVQAVFGPNDPVPMTLVAIPDYPCPGKPLPTPLNPVSPPGPQEGYGVLHGKVNIGPLCPVEPCTRDAGDIYSSRALLLQPESGVMIRVPLNVDGSFKASVKFGIYVVNLSDCAFLGCNRSLPQKEVIRANETTELNISIDTGIR